MKCCSTRTFSRHLVTRLASTFPDSVHVTSVGLQQATDRGGWEYAGGHDFVLVSKDSDLAFIHGPPPKVIWLRVGNAATTAIEELLVAAADVVSAFAANEQDAVLVLRPVPGAANNNPIRASGYRDADHPRTPATRQ